MHVLSPVGRLNRLQYFVQSLCATFGLHTVVAIFLVRAVMSRYSLVEVGQATSAQPATLLMLGLMTLFAIFGALCAWVMLASQVKRLHDLNQSGWLALINLVPGAGLVMWVVLVVAKGEERRNAYGFAAA